MMSRDMSTNCVLVTSLNTNSAHVRFVNSKSKYMYEKWAQYFVFQFIYLFFNQDMAVTVKKFSSPSARQPNLGLQLLHYKNCLAFSHFPFGFSFHLPLQFSSWLFFSSSIQLSLLKSAYTYTYH
jgi:hypothetical protein